MPNSFEGPFVKAFHFGTVVRTANTCHRGGSLVLSIRKEAFDVLHVRAGTFGRIGHADKGVGAQVLSTRN